MRLIGTPKSESELIDCLLACPVEEVVVPRGAESLVPIAVAGQRPKGVISLKELNVVMRLERDDFYVVCAAGTPLTELFAVLERHNLRFPFLLEGQTGTVGGMVARGQLANEGGCFTISRWVLAVRVLLADGTISKSGAITYKSVAGYDLPKLFCGSFGTLGIIVEASLRIYPRQAGPFGKDLAPAPRRVAKLADQVCRATDLPKAEVIANRIKGELDPRGRFPAIVGWNEA